MRVITFLILVYASAASATTETRSTPFELCRHLLSAPLVNASDAIGDVIARLPAEPVADANYSILTLTVPFGLAESPIDMIQRLAEVYGLRIPDGMWSEVGLDARRTLHVVLIGRPPEISRFLGSIGRDPKLSRQVSVALAVNPTTGRLPMLEPAEDVVLIRPRDFQRSLRALATEDPGQVKLINVPDQGYFLARVPVDLLPLYAEKIGGEPIPEEPVNVDGLLAEVATVTVNERRTYPRFLNMLERVMRGQARVVFVNRNKPEFALVRLSDLAQFQRVRTRSAAEISYPHRSVPQRVINGILESPTAVYESKTPPAESAPANAPKPPVSKPSPAKSNADRREVPAAKVYTQPTKLTVPGSEIEVSVNAPRLTLTYGGKPGVWLLSVSFVRAADPADLQKAYFEEFGLSLLPELSEQIESYRKDRASITSVTQSELNRLTGPNLLRRDNVAVVTTKDGSEDVLLIVPVR